MGCLRPRRRDHLGQWLQDDHQHWRESSSGGEGLAGAVVPRRWRGPSPRCVAGGDHCRDRRCTDAWQDACALHRRGISLGRNSHSLCCGLTKAGVVRGIGARSGTPSRRGHWRGNGGDTLSLATTAKKSYLTAAGAGGWTRSTPSGASLSRWVLTPPWLDRHDDRSGVVLGRLGVTRRQACPNGGIPTTLMVPYVTHLEGLRDPAAKEDPGIL